MNLEEIAQLAGVSRSTVSRVVNDDPRVSDAARQRVQEIILANNYHPNAAARSLASRRSRILGLLIPRSVMQIWNDPFFMHLLHGAVEACNDADYHLTILMDSSDGPSAGELLYRRVIKGHHVDGVIIAANLVEDPIVDRLLEDQFPFILVGRHPQREVNFVDVDNRSGAQEAVAHLIGHGYRNIAMISGAANMIASIDRFAGYVTALQESGRMPDSRLAIHSDFTRRGGYRAMNDLLSQPQRPDAVFVASDTMASGALQALRDAGMSTPGDMAVMGFDGLEEVQVSQPILSTVVQPIYDLGYSAVNGLLSLVANGKGHRVQQILPTHLDLRTSCGCAKPPVLLTTSSGGREEVMPASSVATAN